MQEPHEAWVPSLGGEDSLEKGMDIYSSILAWRIPWAEEPGGLQSIGLQRVRHNRSDLLCTHAKYLLVNFFEGTIWTRWNHMGS